MQLLLFSNCAVVAGADGCWLAAAAAAAVLMFLRVYVNRAMLAAAPAFLTAAALVAVAVAVAAVALLA